MREIWTPDIMLYNGCVPKTISGFSPRCFIVQWASNTKCNLANGLYYVIFEGKRSSALGRYRIERSWVGPIQGLRGVLLVSHAYDRMSLRNNIRNRSRLCSPSG